MTVAVESVDVEIDGTPIVRDIEFSLGDRERIAIMGPSGAGKSTVLRAIAGLAPVARGRVAIGGVDRTTTPPHERGVGLMFQDYALFPHLDVAGNVGYGLRMRGVTGEERRTRVAEMLEIVGLADHAERAVESLSGGEQQRVALARTLAPRPEVVLLDEPMGSLDQALKDDLLAEMRSILGGLGMAAIYVTHDRLEAEAFAERIAIMREGRLLRIDRPEALWRDPRTEFVARFMGHRTIVDGALVGRSGRVVVMEHAIASDPSGPITGIVSDSAFRDGRHRITLEAMGTELSFWSRHGATTGDRLSISIDDGGIADLVDETVDG